MSHKHGADLGGIRTLEDLRIRCRINEDTDCWLWSMSTCDGNPRVHVVIGGASVKMTGKAAAYFLANGTRPIAGRHTYSVCHNKLCVNPEHIQIGTRIEHGAFIRRSGVWRNQPNRIAANRATVRSREATKLTVDIASDIRRSELTNAALAKLYGVPASHIGAIKRGESWKPAAVANASVFTFRGVA